MIRNIAITGSSGFIGSYFIKNITDFSIYEVDLLTQKIEEVDFTGIDTVLHLAALVHQMKSKDDDQYFKVNRDLAYETAKRAKVYGVKQFVLMSTVKVYGESTNDMIPWNENTSCNPVDPYGRSKYEAEKLIKGLENESFRVAIVRSPLVYGAEVKANMYNLIKLIDKFPVLPLGGINNKRSFVYVGNLTALIKQIMIMQASGIFIPADHEPLSTSQICSLIAKCLSKKIKMVIVPTFFIRFLKRIRPLIYNRLFGSLIVDNSRTIEVLQFAQPFSTEQGIKIMVDWYKKISS